MADPWYVVLYSRMYCCYSNSTGEICRWYRISIHHSAVQGGTWFGTYPQWNGNRVCNSPISIPMSLIHIKQISGRDYNQMVWSHSNWITNVYVSCVGSTHHIVTRVSRELLLQCLKSSRRLKSVFREKLLPWVVSNAWNSAFYMNIYFENHWEQPLDSFRREFNLSDPPSPEIIKLTEPVNL